MARRATRRKHGNRASDNVHLSALVRFDGSGSLRPGKFAIDCKSAVARYADAALAANTRRAYRSDLRHYLAWGGKVPADADTLARYLSDHAPSLSPSTLLRRLAAISCAHRALGAPDPTKANLVRRVLQGIRRIHGRPLRQVKAISTAHLRRIAERQGKSKVDRRDVALMLVGFFGALRRSELTNLDMTDIEVRANSLMLIIRRSKTDSAGLGRRVILSARDDVLCPIRALRLWIRAIAEKEGPLFRSLSTNVRGRDKRLSTESVALIVKRRLRAIGENPRHFSGHSLRAGYATAAIRQGIPLPLVMHQTGHRTVQTLARYVRQADQPLALAGLV